MKVSLPSVTSVAQPHLAPMLFFWLLSSMVQLVFMRVFFFFRCSVAMPELPHEVQRFLENLYDYLYARDTDKVRRLYEVDFPTISEQFFANEPWPSFDTVEQFYQAKKKEHDLIKILYKELFYRHLSSRRAEPNWKWRIETWQNYGMLFDFLHTTISDAEAEDQLALPSQWLWDMFDEFFKQYHDTQNGKWELIRSIALGEGSLRSADEDGILGELWDTRHALAILYQFVEVSRINSVLSSGQQLHELLTPEGVLPLKLQMGYFASVSLLRINNVFCDYSEALKCVQFLSLGQKAFSWQVPSCHTLFHYNVAFARMMSKRYADATKCAAQILTLTTKSKGYFSSYSIRTKEIMELTIDKLYLLTLMCDMLSSDVKVDEYIMAKIRDMFRDKILKLQNDPDETFAELFKRVCPSFVSPAIWNQKLKPTLVALQEPSHIVQRQLNTFVRDIGHQRKIDQLLSFAKLYNNVSLSKLAILMGLSNADNPKKADSIREQVRAELISVKASQSPESSMGVEFIVEDDSVHVTPQRSTELFLDQYIKQNNKVMEMIEHVQNLDMNRIAVAIDNQ
eukprot:Gregarina_sp_Poly_1__3202@NODE_190_length_11648_cov_127_353855_g169_i0_p3_GENE_NODE_190_length_11648_cov_127_353855_g169_i0NODE_190_length_11648_cov_127_353855_g169_i0_p3_ORF_typecomplete_len567_score88_17Paf67/PF10255_9/1_9e78DUF3808/PF10300_9/0_014NYDSP28_assoc/PF14775_6/0_92NYDSP28_assoc/PF14775_6/1_8e02NYDSP28_assoc/PF14775_6/8_3e03FANCI_HD1/PF14679_6/0_91FANCI_HD1/PF14679_6/1e03VPR/PF00522_18/1_6e04VPR/PF00522_18/2_9e03VPR/PF00522_18/0_17_NODE_190_length_11648_cov_127_353855_g169_i060027702